MPSDYVTRILLSKTDLTAEEIMCLTEAQAWRLIYSVPRQKRDGRLQVCFTGFGASQKSRLTEAAQSANLRVVSAVTKELALLVCGPNAGPKKIEKAGTQGAMLLEVAEFEAFLKTGEMPSSPFA